MCEGYELVKTPAKEIAQTNSQSQINQSKHEFNDEAPMANDETIFKPFVLIAVLSILPERFAPGTNSKRAISSVKHLSHEQP